MNIKLSGLVDNLLRPGQKNGAVQLIRSDQTRTKDHAEMIHRKPILTLLASLLFAPLATLQAADTPQPGNELANGTSPATRRTISSIRRTRR